MVSGRQAKDGCRICGSNSVKVLPADKTESLVNKFLETKYHCLRCGIVYTSSLLDLKFLKKNKPAYGYIGKKPNTEEFTDINLYRPLQKKNSPVEIEELPKIVEQEKQKEIIIDSELISSEKAYRMAIALGGLKFSIEINRELGEALGKAASGVKSFVSEVKSDLEDAIENKSNTNFVPREECELKQES
ncbi:MAG: hypothetical protein KDD56_08140 [Bdellovibrionales bacterium]|nr:hypothetical protein [Bdellovibrionales bacterium]